MNEVPRVNLFLGYVDSLRGKSSNDKYVKENFEARRFYSSSKDYDYVKYVNSGSKEKIDYVQYSGNNEKSKGIFNANGLLSQEQIKDLRTQLRKSNSPIWHGVISFTEEFGNQFCDTYEKALNLMKIELPKFFTKAGLDPENIVWFAGLHENTDNKHIHFSFFEKSPLRKKQNTDKLSYSNGFIPVKAINSFKVCCELRLLNIYDDIAKYRKSLTKEMFEKVKTGDYMEKIKSLIVILPNEGRMQYDSENMKCYKQQIDLVINSIIKANKELKKKFDNFDNILARRDAELINAYNKIKVDYHDKLIRDKTMNDIYRRLGNIVLRAVKDIRSEQAKLEYDTKRHLVKKRLDKLKRKALINKCLQLNELVNREIISSFQEYLDKIEEANFKRMKEEGLLD